MARSRANWLVGATAIAAFTLVTTTHPGMTVAEPSADGSSTPHAVLEQDITITNPNADGSYTARADILTLADVTSGVSLECQSNGSETASTSWGTLPSGSYTTPADVGDLNAEFGNCNGPAGPVTLTLNDQPYDMVITSYDPQAGAAGQGIGYVGPVNVHVSMSGCAFDVVGNGPGRFDSATHTPSIGGTLPLGVAPLEPINISGCAGLVNPRDELSIEVDYEVTDPANPWITLSSP